LDNEVPRFIPSKHGDTLQCIRLEEEIGPQMSCVKSAKLTLPWTELGMT
jgi:hypothetical protein